VANRLHGWAGWRQIDPGTFTAASLREYRALGVTRFSVGIQSFQQVGAISKFNHIIQSSLVVERPD
jgi:coproporphyrinogen III oxidase-like Fe-S oxidoreductase